MLLVLPIFGSQLAAFIQRLPEYIGKLQNLLTGEGESAAWLRDFVGDRLPSIQSGVNELVSQGAAYMLTLIQGLWTGGQALLSVFSLLVITPVVAFYILNDWYSMVHKVDSWLPVRHRHTIRDIARQMDGAIAGFVRGQSLVCLILGSFYAISLTMTGLNFGFVIGFVSGIITFIPYVGSLTGLVLAGGVAIVQFFPDYSMIAIVIGIFVFGQFVEGYILSPKLVGDSVGLHPVWLMFALLAFGYLLGFLGLLLAVPLAAAVGVLVRFAINNVGMEEMDPVLNGTTSMALSHGDPIAPMRVINKFAKQFNGAKFTIKAGFMDGKVLSMDEIRALAELPSKEALQAQVLGTMLAPITSLAIVLKAICEQKGGTVEAEAPAAAE